MNLIIRNKPAAGYPNFSTIENKLYIININNFNDRFFGDILAARVDKKSSIKRTGLVGIISFILALLAYAPVNAQTGYNDEDDYDDYYESAYSTENPYERYNYNHKHKEEERYKRTNREEDLYNGRYRSQRESNSSWNPTNISIGGINRTNPSGSHHTNSRQNNGRSSENGFNAGPGDGRNIDLDPANDRPGGADDQGQGKSTGGDPGDNQGPPPPPDEPDVPVDTAIPFLIVAGIGLASFKFYIRKRASVN